MVKIILKNMFVHWQIPCHVNIWKRNTLGLQCLEFGSFSCCVALFVLMPRAVCLSAHRAHYTNKTYMALVIKTRATFLILQQNVNDAVT